MNKVRLILSILVFVMNLRCFSEESSANKTITEKIGDKNITFNIPEDKDLLEKYYRALIYTYIASERKNLEYQKTLQKYVSMNNKLRKDYNIISRNVKETKSDFDEYTKSVNKSKIYTGISLEYIVGVNKTHVASLGFDGAVVFRRIILNASIPISILANQNSASPLSFGAGMRVGLLFRLN